MSGNILTFNKITRCLRTVGTGTQLLPYAVNDTPARLSMFNNHLGQGSSIRKPSRRKIVTLAEKDWANYTFGRRVKNNCEVIAVIPKYISKAHPMTPKSSPYSVVVVEEYIDDRTLRYDYFTTDRCEQHHPTIGMDLIYDKNNPVHLDSRYHKGAVIAKPRTVDKYGNYNPGREVNVAYLSNVGNTEDGFIISESLAKAMGLTTMGSYVEEWGRKRVPLNTYGFITEKGKSTPLMTAYEISSGQFKCTATGKYVTSLRRIKGEVIDSNGNIRISQSQYEAGFDIHYRPFPGVGDKIRPDGLVFATREINERSAIVDLTSSALMVLDHQWDKPVYGQANAEVYDVTVLQGDVKSTEATLTGMSEMTQYYNDALIEHYRSIAELERRLLAKHGRKIPCTRRLNKLFRDARALVPEFRPRTEGRVDYVYRGAKFDHWRVEVKYKHYVDAAIGFKPSDFHGGKGVNVRIVPDDWMPVDKWGTRADLIMDWLSIIKRMNLGQMYEHHINAHSDQQLRRIREMVALNKYEEAYESMLKYYACVSHVMVPKMQQLYTTYAQKVEHINKLLTGHLEDEYQGDPTGAIYLVSTIDSPITAAQQVRNLEKHFPLETSKVNFIGLNSGLPRTSKLDVIIASKYMIMLEKIPSGLSAVSSSKLQVHGLPGPINQTDKRGYPMKRQANKAVSETEGRLYCATIGGEAMAEMLDATGNAEAHKAQVRSFVSSEQPTNLDRSINRDDVPLGNSRPIALYKHQFDNLGITVEYEEDTLE